MNCRLLLCILIFVASFGLLLQGCLDWGPPSTGADGDADIDSDADADADSDADSIPDADADGDLNEDAEPDSDPDEETPDDPCDSVTCSGHGSCFTDGDEAICVCDDGYHAEGLECVCSPRCEGRECGDDGCGESCPPSCGEDERCVEETGLCECVPDCGERVCGMDPVCRTLDCGSCTSSDERCSESGVCEVPSCGGGLLDISTGLCWQNPPPGGRRTWSDAVDYCDELNLGGHGPGSWHLPTISELRSIVRGCPETETGGACGVSDECLEWTECRPDCGGCASGRGPGGGGAYWPDRFSGPPDFFWSSSPDHVGGSVFAWLIAFTRGHIYNQDKTVSVDVRCVRSGP